MAAIVEIERKIFSQESGAGEVVARGADSKGLRAKSIYCYRRVQPQACLSSGRPPQFTPSPTHTPWSHGSAVKRLITFYWQYLCQYLGRIPVQPTHPDVTELRTCIRLPHMHLGRIPQSRGCGPIWDDTPHVPLSDVGKSAARPQAQPHPISLGTSRMR